MSGQQIGTVIGGAIGAYFGGPAGAQVGMAIGGYIGGAVDPTKVYGPRIGDGQQQSATDGAPIAWVQGTAMIAGTIVQVGPRRQVKHKNGGKGTGPVQVTYTASQDFAILVCESSELRGSTVTGISMVFQDGKLVYDVRPGSTMLSASYKWKANVDFLFGDEAQMPHPTLEAITGVGNTPAYRGSCLAVFKNFDVSSAGDRIPSFQFVVTTAAFQYVPDFAVDANSASPEPGSTNSLVINCDVSSQVILQVVRGTTYGGWSKWPTDTSTGVPAEGAWFCQVTIRNEDTGVIYRVFDTYKPTQAEALTAAVLEGPVAFTGGSQWSIWCEDGVTADNRGGMSVRVSVTSSDAASVPLSTVAQNIATRGGLSVTDIDVTALSSASVVGYPIARQVNGADGLLPLLQAYFAYGTEYEGKLFFQFYGQDAGITIDAADLLEGNDANDGAIKKNLRNQATEFPRRVVGKYMDAAQNYMTVTVAAERRSVDVIAIGDQSFDIPVVMAADDAAKAVDKALKVAYATLEGKIEYSVPFAGSDTYLKLAAGEPVIFNGKRWIADEVIVSTGYLKLTTRYDRQSAYASNVQAIPGNTPTPPSSSYSGPTTLVPMDLPALRPQDSFGIYLAAGSSVNSSDWVGCTVQISYDDQATWQTALTIYGACAVGSIESASPFRVLLEDESLESATDAQLAANANVFGIVGANGVTELAQFATATSTGTALEYDIDGLSRGLAGGVVVSDPTGYRFATLDYAYFLPIDPSFAGRTLYLRGIGFGEDEADATIESIIYTARSYDPGTPLAAEDGTLFVAENDVDIIYTEQTP